MFARMLATLLWGFVTCSAFAQVADSLAALLQQTRGQARLPILYALSSHYDQRDWEMAIRYAEEMLPLAEKQSDDSMRFEVYYLLSKVYEGGGRDDQALTFGQKALTVAQEDHRRAMALHHLGLVHEARAEYELALDHLLQALQIRQQSGTLKQQANTLGSLAFVYRATRQFDKAIEVLQQSIALSQEAGDPKGVARATFNTGWMLLESGEYRQAIGYFHRAVQGMNEQDSPQQFSSYYNNLANCYEKLVKENPIFYDSALYFGYKNLHLKNRIGDLRGLGNAHNNLAAIYERASEYDSSYHHATRSLALADSLGYLPIKKNAFKYLLSAEIFLGKRESLNQHLEEYYRVEEQLSEQAFSDRLSEMSTRYETEKKEAENELLRLEAAQQQRVKWLLLVVSVLLLVLLGALLVLYRIRQRSHARLVRDTAIISEQARQLQALNDLKSQFFANISHELRTPLTLILGNTEDALAVDKLPLKAEDRMKKVRRHGRQLTAMVNDLLDLSRLELKKYEIKPEPLPLDALLVRVCAAFASLADSRQVTLQFEAGLPDGQAVLADAVQLEKVLNNLIYNAFKFTKAGGQIRLNTQINEETALITVTDTGIGIPEKDLPFIFDRFYQASNHSSGQEGTGLGLAIAKELVALMNGQLKVRSSSAGSVFTIALPLTHAAAQTPTLAGHEPDEESAGPSLAPLEIPANAEILIVEDNPEMADYLRGILSDHFRISLAANGQEALDRLRVQVPDLILSDLMMPEMDGWQLLERLRQNAEWNRIPVILLTAVIASENRLKALRLGVDDYIVKPFEAEELLVRVTNVIRNLRERIQWAKETADEPDTSSDLDTQNELVLRIREYVLDHIADRQLNVPQLAMHLAMSERQLYRKVTAATGLQPAKLITEIKLRHARELLLAGRVHKVAQLAAEVGFESASHFSKLYQERFGKKPADYLS